METREVHNSSNKNGFWGSHSALSEPLNTYQTLKHPIGTTSTHHQRRGFLQLQ